MSDPEAEAIVKMTAENKGCEVSDLQWKRDRYGNIHVRRRNADTHKSETCSQQA